MLPSLICTFNHSLTYDDATWTYLFHDIIGSPVNSCCLLYSAPSISPWNMMKYDFICSVILQVPLWLHAAFSTLHLQSVLEIWTYPFHDLLGSPVTSNAFSTLHLQSVHEIWTCPFHDLIGSPVTSCCLFYSAPSISHWNVMTYELICSMILHYRFPCDIMLPFLLCTFSQYLKYELIRSMIL